MKTKICLLLIIFLALFLRLYRLNGYPPSFWQDITANAYDAYSILKTGKDQWGTVFPFPLIKSLGDYKMALAVYFLIPGIKLLGLNELGIRVNMVFISILTVILAYIVGKKIGKSVSFGLVTAFLLAISPWDIGLARHGWEANLGILFFLGGLYFLLTDKKLTLFNFLLASVFLGIGSYAYHPFRVFIPAFFLLVAILYLNKEFISKYNFLVGIFVFLLIFTPNLLSLLSPVGQIRIEINRFDKTAEFIQQIKNQNMLGTTLIKLSFATRNYFRLFSTDFLFNWGSTDAVFEMNNRGVSYFWLIPFIFYGLYIILKRRNTTDKLLLIWLLLWPLPTVIVANPYNLVKTAHLIPLLEVISTIGIIGLLNSKVYKQHKYTVPLLGLLILFSVSKYFIDYYATYPLYSPSWYQAVEKNTFAVIDKYKEQYPRIVLSQKLEPYIYLLFYEKIDPRYYQTTGDKKMLMVGKFGEAHLQRLGKFFYSTGIEKDVSAKTMYAFPPAEIPSPENYKLITLAHIKDYLGNEKITVFSWKKLK